MNPLLLALELNHPRYRNLTWVSGTSYIDAHVPTRRQKTLFCFNECVVIPTRRSMRMDFSADFIMSMKLENYREYRIKKDRHNSTSNNPYLADLVDKHGLAFSRDGYDTVTFDEPSAVYLKMLMS